MEHVCDPGHASLVEPPGVPIVTFLLKDHQFAAQLGQVRPFVHHSLKETADLQFYLKNGAIQPVDLKTGDREGVSILVPEC